MTPYEQRWILTWTQRTGSFRRYLAAVINCNEANWPLPILEFATHEPDTDEQGTILLYPMLANISATDDKGADVPPLDRNAVQVKFWARKVFPNGSLGAPWSMKGSLPIDEQMTWQEPAMTPAGLLGSSHEGARA